VCLHRAFNPLVLATDLSHAVEQWFCLCAVSVNSSAFASCTARWVVFEAFSHQDTVCATYQKHLWFGSQFGLMSSILDFHFGTVLHSRCREVHNGQWQIREFLTRNRNAFIALWIDLFTCHACCIFVIDASLAVRISYMQTVWRTAQFCCWSELWNEVWSLIALGILVASSYKVTLQKTSVSSNEVDQSMQLAVFFTAGGFTTYWQLYICFCVGHSNFSVYGALMLLHIKKDHSWSFWDCPFDPCRLGGTTFSCFLALPS
jgi:hypothetical protein